MAGNGEERMKMVADLTANILNTINKVSKIEGEDIIPNASPRRSGSPFLHGSITTSHGKGASTSTTEEALPAVKKLIEASLMNTLTNILNKPAQRAIQENVGTRVAPITSEQHSPPPPVAGITHNVNNAGDDTLTSILRKMEEMENENKILRDQMKEHQERVDKIPSDTKLLPKRDAGRFVEQPYSDEVAPHVIPKTFKMRPYLKIYDGTTDPEDHVTHYVTAVKGNDIAKEQVSSILLKKYGETLTGGALTWYSQLPARSTETFKEMADKFVTAHAGTKKAKAMVNNIFTIKQLHGEGLRDFLTRFNRVKMTVPNVSEGMAVMAFYNGLNWSGLRATTKLLSRLIKYPPTILDEIHNAYCAKVRADEDDLNGPTQRLTSVQAESRKDLRNDNRRDLAGLRPNRERHQIYVRGTIMLAFRHDEGPSRPRIGTHRNEREIVYALEKLNPKVKWLQKMRSDLNTRKSNALCEFHQERGNKTEDYISLRQDAMNMLHQGHLKELLSNRGRINFTRGREQHPPKPPSPTRTIQMIIGGGDDASINNVKFTTTHKLKWPITHERYDELEEIIIFDKSDTHSLVFPYYDALDITLRILDKAMRQIMVDDGSGACIIHPRVLAQMKLGDKIVPRCITLTGFNNAIEQTSGEITHPVLVGGVTLKTTFHIIDQDTTYNAIIGRPWIHAMNFIPPACTKSSNFPLHGEYTTSEENNVLPENTIA
ncbi:uncharacterized protein [Nicotiana sylvestris]|uniref:uncharacterized protein n=1 Tax=Nicotiana sylvestris TaxID=4096 RepID=UPI00388CCE3B